MRIALLSDIHANLPALEAALQHVHQEKPDNIYVCGDNVGYYFWPKEVLDLLDNEGAVSIRGNHEDMLVQLSKGTIDSVSVRSKYGPGLDIALAELRPEKLAEMEQLPHPLHVSTDQGGILICHGSPSDINEYVYPDSELHSLVSEDSVGTDWIVMGHTHYPMHTVSEGAQFINPGSVGQPRNRVPGAHWAMLDTETDRVEFFNTQYDHSLVAKEARRRCPDLPYLENVLGRT